MKKLGNVILTVVVMMAVSCISLAVISILANINEWKSDKALLGIIVTYIIAGFAGGFLQKIRNLKQEGMGKKIMESIMAASVFMFVLALASVFVIQTPFRISQRFFMIWMLLIGSACLGRIL